MSLDLSTKSFLSTVESSSAQTEANSTKCAAVVRPDLAVFQIIVCLSVAWNFLVLWAIVKSRIRLRQNFVYSFVTSVVSANIALGVVMILTLFSFLTPFERPIGVDPFAAGGSDFDHTDQTHNAIMYWFTFRKALVVGLFLVMSSNVVALIGGIIQSASFVGRAAATARARLKQRKLSITKSGKANIRLNRYQKAALTISLAWIVPFIYTLACYGCLDCVRFCDCLPAYYAETHFCSSQNETYIDLCSNVWAPLTNGYLLVAVGWWLLQSIAIFGLLAKAMTKYRSARKPQESTHNSRPSSSGIQKSKSISENPNNNQSNNTEVAKATAKIKLPMHPTIKLLISLSVCYTVCTAPMMMCFTVDAILSDRTAVNDVIVTASSIIAFLYTYICPAFLVAYMPGLRKALIKFLLPCSCTRTTVVHRVARLATIKKVKKAKNDIK